MTAADDGFSGTNFSRPAFQRMIADVESGRVKTIIVKDMSRFGRNYLQVGMYTEMMFPDHDVRFIAINDGVDSELGDNEFTPFRNIINEWYAKDTSKKIRAVKKAQMERGERTNDAAPYGYTVEEKKLVVDEETAPVVRKIFKWCIEGYGPSQIARMLTEEKILTPSAYRFTKRGNYGTRSYASEAPYSWNEQTVIKILEYREYTGCTVLGKSIRKSFKDKRKRDVPEEQRKVFMGTHEPIISETDYELVQKIRQGKRKNCKNGEKDKFAGLLVCADCGKTMYNHRAKSLDKTQESFVCGNYRHKTKNCTAHYIRTEVLETLVLQELRWMLSFAKEYETEFAETIRSEDAKRRSENKRQKQRTLAKAENRIAELDRLIQGLYEANISGKLTDERFTILMNTYELEQKTLKEQTKSLAAELEEIHEQDEGLDKFLKIVRSHTEITELTPALLREFIDKIAIHEKTVENGQKKQRIDIYYNFIGIVKPTR